MDDLKKERPDMFHESGSMKYEIFERDIRPHNFIYVRNDVNSLAFTIQNGPVKENGVNGCQVDTVIHAAAHIIRELNKNFPCAENEEALRCLAGAIDALESRKKNREKRGVEGLNKA